MADSVDKHLSQAQYASARPEVSQIYAQFAGLVGLAKKHFACELGGKLLLYGQLDAAGAAKALAANIAGAATLGVDDDRERLRQGIRHAFCDFVVNSLDEALRILKNEVRKKQPVSVCLEGDLASALREAVERGLQPDLLACSAQEKAEAGRLLIERGAIAVDDQPDPAGSLPGSTSRSTVTWRAESAAALWLPRVDALAAQVLPADDDRRRWLRLAPRYLGRLMAAQRFLPMTSAEAERLMEIVDAAVASGEIGARITIRCQQ